MIFMGLLFSQRYDYILEEFLTYYNPYLSENQIKAIVTQYCLIKDKEREEE